MGFSKSTRIMILLGIDTAFFLLELIVGSAVHSLALVADSFHMLNDVLSLCVGLWAVKVAHQKSSSRMYTYGWQRAETLGALVNGVFLVALCLSIFLEAIQRFFEPQTVSNPKLILVVGCFGLLSNILGLFLFHEHGHSHGGGHGHSHGGSDKVTAAEEGHSHVATGGHAHAVADEGGNVADVLPQSTVGGWPKSSALDQTSTEDPRNQHRHSSKDFTSSDEAGSTLTDSTSPVTHRKSYGADARRRSRQNSGGSRSRFSSVDDMRIHPASFRNEIIAASRLEDIESRDGSDTDGEEAVVEEEDGQPTEASPLLGQTKTNGSAKHLHSDSTVRNYGHADHKHSQPKDEDTGGHSHGDLNMRGVFLHVMGDALGNIGVIGSALIIWLTKYSWRFYSDPAISLVITVIILGSAIPLCKAASRILLQAVPAHINTDEIKEDIRKLPGVLSCHHLHVWQLSDVKVVASLHIRVEYDLKDEGSARYMELAQAVQRCLHEYGIHSSTIQPEFCLDRDHHHVSTQPSDNEGSDTAVDGSKSKITSKGGSRTASMRSGPETCLLECGDECDEDGKCCTPKALDAEAHNEDARSH